MRGPVLRESTWWLIFAFVGATAIAVGCMAAAVFIDWMGL